MAGIPEPDEEIPAFVVEVLDEQSPERLDAVVDYLGGTGGTDRVPDQVVEAATMQDDRTVDAMASFSEDLAAFYRESEHDSVLAALEAGDTADADDSDGEDGTSALRYGSL